MEMTELSYATTTSRSERDTPSAKIGLAPSPRFRSKLGSSHNFKYGHLAPAPVPPCLSAASGNQFAARKSLPTGPPLIVVFALAQMMSKLSSPALSVLLPESDMHIGCSDDQTRSTSPTKQTFSANQALARASGCNFRSRSVTHPLAYRAIVKSSPRTYLPRLSGKGHSMDSVRGGAQLFYRSSVSRHVHPLMLRSLRANLKSPKRNCSTFAFF
jgi:hypothetical protein